MTQITETDIVKYKLLTDLYFFSRYFYKELNGKKFLQSNHFEVLSSALEKVYRHETTRLIVTMPPRMGKTEIAVVNFIAKGLVLNPSAKFIHTSYSETLALENSERIKDLIQSDNLQGLFPLELKRDSKSKRKWWTDQGGGIYATSSGGQITGFGAGIMKEDEETLHQGISDIESAKGFGGAIVIDDALKPEDAQSATVRKKINDRFYNTILSRVNSPNTPIIVIGQRLHKDDLPGMLLKDGGWTHLNMPAIDSEGNHLWEYRRELVEEIKEKKPSVFLAQYQQRPELARNENEWFHAYSDEKHYTKDKYVIDKRYPIDCIFDFNKNPCVALVCQYIVDKNHWAVFGAHYATPQGSKSSLQVLCEDIRHTHFHLINKNNVRIAGDATGKSGSADRAPQDNKYALILRYLGLNKSHLRVEKSNIKHAASRDLCNDVLHQLPGGAFMFYAGTEMLIDNMKASYPDDSDTLNGAKKELGLHDVDCIRYTFKLYFAYNLQGKNFKKYQSYLTAMANKINRNIN